MAGLRHVEIADASLPSNRPAGKMTGKHINLKMPDEQTLFGCSNRHSMDVKA